jgi:hypothetical protein
MDIFFNNKHIYSNGIKYNEYIIYNPGLSTRDTHPTRRKQKTSTQRGRKQKLHWNAIHWISILFMK